MIDLRFIYENDPDFSNRDRKELSAQGVPLEGVSYLILAPVEILDVTRPIIRGFTANDIGHLPNYNETLELYPLLPEFRKLSGLITLHGGDSAWCKVTFREKEYALGRAYLF